MTVRRQRAAAAAAAAGGQAALFTALLSAAAGLVGFGLGPRLGGVVEALLVGLAHVAVEVVQQVVDPVADRQRHRGPFGTAAGAPARARAPAVGPRTKNSLVLDSSTQMSCRRRQSSSGSVAQGTRGSPRPTTARGRTRRRRHGRQRPCLILALGRGLEELRKRPPRRSRSAPPHRARASSLAAAAAAGAAPPPPRRRRRPSPPARRRRGVCTCQGGGVLGARWRPPHTPPRPPRSRRCPQRASAATAGNGWCWCCWCCCWCCCCAPAVLLRELLLATAAARAGDAPTPPSFLGRR